MVHIVGCAPVVFHLFIVKPVALVIPSDFAVLAVEVMPRWKRFIALALSFECLQFAGHIHLAVVIISDVERNDTDGVARHEKGLLLLIVECKGKNAVELFKKIHPLVTIQRKDDFAVASRLKTVSVAVAFPDFLMVVDFAVHGKHQPAVRTEQWLSSGFRVDDG